MIQYRQVKSHFCFPPKGPTRPHLEEHIDGYFDDKSRTNSWPISSFADLNCVVVVFRQDHGRSEKGADGFRSLSLMDVCSSMYWREMGSSLFGLGWDVLG